ncbi:MAG: phytanoyl-CoA dioxygenase family protein, partial [Candidatus Poribacteria bacterium]|nr:phytanoyl-CoA dioxygenase family protein [Candidatus Poribacteria bacterium]
MRKITNDEIQFFDDNGFVICRGVLNSDELQNYRDESARLIDRIMKGGTREDEMCGRGPEGVPYYLNYLHSQTNDFSLRLLAHPFVGDLLTRMVGPDFIPCYESLVFKLPGNGSSVHWH